MARQLRGQSTVGARLKKEREALGIELTQVEEATNIRRSYLLALERGTPARLPEIYWLGFLRQYAVFLKLNPDELVSELQKEVEPHLVSAHLRFAPKRVTDSRTIDLTARNLFLVGAAVFVSVVFGLIGLQLYRFAGMPSITITSPASRFVLAPEGDVAFAGKVERQQEFLLNNQPVTITPQGEFTQTLHFPPGVSTVELVAIGRQGRTNRRLITVSVPQPTAREQSTISN